MSQPSPLELGIASLPNPEALPLERAFALDPATSAPDVAIPPTEAGISAANQLIRVHQTWREPGLNRNLAAIRRGGAVFMRLYDLYVGDEEKVEGQRAIGWGWIPEHVAAQGIRGVLINRWAQLALRSEGQATTRPPRNRTWTDVYRDQHELLTPEDRLSDLYGQMGDEDMGYLLPVTQSGPVYGGYED